MEKITKEDLKEDSFLSLAHTVGDFVSHHIKTILALVVLILAGLVGWGSYGFYAESQEVKASDLMYAAQKKVDDLEKPEPPAKPEDPKKKEEPKPPKKIDYSEAIQKFKEVIEKYPKTQTAVAASLEASSLLHKEGQFDEALKLLTNVENTASGGTILKALLLDRLAVAYEAQGKCDKSIEYWKTLESDQRYNMIQGRALVSMGLCYEKLNQLDKAKESYTRAEAIGADPENSKKAKKYLRLLASGKNP